MPFREQQLDTGFTTYQSAPPHLDPEAPANPLGPLGDMLQIVSAPINPTGAIAAYGRQHEMVDAAFRIENPVLAAVDLFTRPKFTQVDPSFDVGAQLKKDGLWDQYRDNFLGVTSEPEYWDTANRIARENADNNTIARNGLAGGVARMVAGSMSPTMLLPFAPEAQGIMSILKAAALGGTAALLDEVPLQMDQETRSMTDSVGNVAFGTILGGVLGGAHLYLSKKLDDVARDMVNKPGVTYGAEAPFVAPSPVAAGAEARDVPKDFRLVPAGPEVKGVSALDAASVGPMRSPVVQTLNQDVSPHGRWAMSQLSDAGLRFERVVDGKTIPHAPSPGGTAEAVTRLYWAGAADSIRQVDDAFARYWFGKSQSHLIDRIGAGLGPSGGKLNRKQFREAIADAMENEDQHAVPEIAESAAFIRKRVFDPILQEAEKAGLFKNLPKDEEGAIKVKGASSYINRMYNLPLVKARQLDFINTLTTHFQAKVQDQWTAAYAKFIEGQTKRTQRLADMQLPQAQAEELYTKFQEELRGLEKATSPEEDQRKFFATMARKANTEAERANLQSQADAIPISDAEKARQAQVRAVKDRVKNLNRSVGLANKKFAAKLSKVDRSEELQLGSLNRAVRRGQKFLEKLDEMSDKDFDRQISELKDDFAEAGTRFDKNEERITATVEDEKLFALGDKQEALTGKMTDIADELGNLESLDRGAARGLVQDGLDEVLKKVNALNGRRAVRAQKLRDAAAQLSPNVLKQGLKDLQAATNEREQKFLDGWEVRSGGSAITAIRGGAPDFTQYARDLATTTTEKILGTYARLPGHDIMVGDRGPELLRTLDIPAEKLMTQDGKSFLERDIHKLVHSYIRTVAPDVEITKRLGQIEPESGRPLVFMQLEDELRAQQQGLKDTAREKEWSQDKLDKATIKLNVQYDEIKRNLDAVIGRLRGTWGLPKEPGSIGQRLGHIALNLNTLRYMGMVSVSSLPDLAQPIMKYGLLNTFRDGYVPFIQQLVSPELKAVMGRELSHTSAGFELVLHSRSNELQGIGDHMVRGSPFEKSLEWATGKVGLVGLFDLWTTGMKQIAGATGVGRIIDALEVVNGGKASAKEIAQATEFLAQGNIDGAGAQLLWREMQKPGGGNLVNGRWWPNTDKWNRTAAETFRQMLNREIDRTIITPGVERPLIADKNLAMKLLFQFKSFGQASTTKTVLSGLQQRGMANIANQITGATFSLALGTVSYILWARLTGGNAEAQMEEAVASGNWGKFADEAISRSGLLAQMGDVQDILSNIPLTAPHVTFSGQKTTRRAGEDLGEALLGPSYGSLFQSGLSIVTGPGWDPNTGEFRPPNQSWVHQIRLLAPLQNNWALRRGFDAIEGVAKSNLPEHR